MMHWLAYLGIGAVVGFAAGLLGIGGGVVMVPLLVVVFASHGIPAEHVLHIALGTALAAMVFTSVSSMRAHHKHGAVDWKIARAMSPGMLAGSFVAALAGCSRLSTISRPNGTPQLNSRPITTTGVPRQEASLNSPTCSPTSRAP